MGLDAYGYFTLKKEFDNEKFDIEDILKRLHNAHFKDSVGLNFLSQRKELFETDDGKVFGCPIHFDQRYFGEDYTRGNACKIITLIEFLRAQPEVDKIYYGADCSMYEDFLLEWTKQDSIDLLLLFFKHGNGSYYDWGTEIKNSWDNTWGKL